MELKLYGPDEVEFATGGRVTKSDLRNWVKLGHFNTAMREPRAGKARGIPLVAVYEAALLREFQIHGVPLAEAKRWNKEILERIATKGFATVTESGTQHGPAEGGAPQVVLFWNGAIAPLILADAEAGITLNKAFYAYHTRQGPLPSIGAIHLPALLGRIDRLLGVKK